MTIVQLNISGGFKYLGNSHNDFNIGGSILTEYIERLRNLAPDIICLQEAQSDDMAGSNSQAEQIARALGYNFYNTAVSESHLEAGKFLSQAYGALDAILKNQETEEQERLAIARQLDRHERWVTQAAPKLGLPYDEAA